MKQAAFVPLATVAWVIVSATAASAAGFGPMDGFKTWVLGIIGDAGLVAFVAAGLTLFFAHDHMSQIMGTWTKAILVIGVVASSPTWLPLIGINLTSGAWLR